MKPYLNIRVIFLAIFLLLTIAIENSENFQLRDFNDGVGVSESAGVGKTVLSGRTKVRFPFRKLEKVIGDDDDDESEPDDTDEDSEEDDTSDYKFAKVRKPTFEVKKRSLRRSKLAQFRDDESDDDDNSEKLSFFSKILSFFKRKPKEIVDENESKEKADESAETIDDASEEDETEENEKKPLLSEIFNKFKDFLEAREKKSKDVGEINDNSDESDVDTSDEDEINPSDSNIVETVESEKESDSKIKISIKETFNKIFNRKPFNFIFDFNDSGDSKTFEDSEEDEINYQKLLKEEREQEREHTEQLIKQTSEEEAIKHEHEEIESGVVPSAVEESKPSAPKRDKKTKEQAHLAKKEFEKLILNLPSFVPNYSKVKNPECQKQGEVFQRQLRGQKIWALEMMDANAKIPSGLMRGNTNQLGDFDLCTKISQKIKISDTNSMKMKGKYCLANIDVVAAAEQLKLPVHLIQGRNFIRSTINDPNHFFPRYSTINWGLCLPSACTFHDADQILESFIGPYNSTGIKLLINVNEESCYTRQHFDLVNLIKSDWKIFGTCSLLAAIAAATILATLSDYLDSPALSFLTSTSKKSGTEEISVEVPQKDSRMNQILNCFSIKRNAPILFGMEKDSNQVQCLHGLKALSILLLVVSFKLIPMGRVPYSNRNKLTEFFNSPFSVFLRSSFLYEDVFLVVSGTLAALSLLKNIESAGKSVWIKKILQRFLRLVLPLAVVLLFYAFVWEHLGTGPQWSQIVDKNADLCKQSFWRNLLFIQNLFPIEDMCATHTYHLAVDLQLFILTPLLVWMIYKQPSYGLGLYGILHAFSAAARFSSTVENRLSVVVFHGMKLSQLYRTYNLSLAVALHRATPYLIGIALGIIIKEFGKVQLPRGVVFSAWTSTLCGFIWCFYTPSNLSYKDYQYDPTAAAQYSALSPMLWSLGIAWIIFACYSDASWKLNCFLSSRPMIFVSKISYSIYLIVFLVFFYFSGTIKSGEEFHLSSYIDRLEIFIVFTAACVLTLALDIPLKNIVKIFLHSEESSSKSIEDKSEEPDFESPFADEEDDFIARRSKLNLGTETNGYEAKTNGNLNATEEEDETEEEIEEHDIRKMEREEYEQEEVKEEEIPIKKVENNMNARRWKWEMLD